MAICQVIFRWISLTSAILSVETQCLTPNSPLMYKYEVK